MAGISAGRSYRIKNLRSGLYLNVPGYSLSASKVLEQFSLQTDSNRQSQVWHVFPLDYGTYFVANKASGYVMNVTGNSMAPSATAEQFGLQSPSNNPAQTWLLRDAGAGSYEVINDRSQLLLHVAGHSKSHSAVVEQFVKLSGDYYDSERWVFEIEDEYKPVLALSHVANNAIGDIHRMTSFSSTAKDRTDPVEVGAVAYPYLLVKDPAYDRVRQSRENPYYILRRKGFWSRVYSYEHGGASTLTQKETTHVGLTTKNSQTIEETVGIKITHEGGFSLVEGLSAKVATELSYQLKVTATHERTEESWRQVTIERSYSAGKRVTEALWYRDDQYTLERLDGTKVLEWTTRDPNTVITDTYRG